MLNDREIARAVALRPIREVAAELGIGEEFLVPCGRLKAKVLFEKLPPLPDGRGKLVMVTAMTPTTAGEGKTTTAIGLADALRRLGKRAAVALREPSLGPVFGLKGGATGGGRAQVAPADDINLHFTGDMHAITSAHNLLAAMVDNRLQFDGSCGPLDARSVTWKRVLDMDDRVLRDIVVGIGEPLKGIARQTGFDITAASEVMAVFCLSKNLADLKARLGAIHVGDSPDGKPVYARDIKAAGAMTILQQGKVVMESIGASVRDDLCSGCRTCVDLCPYAAISFDDTLRQAMVVESQCHGCGTCAASCPSGAIEASHFTDEQLMGEIEGLLRWDSEPVETKIPASGTKSEATKGEPMVAKSAM